MPFNGSGTFTYTTSGLPVTTGTSISSTVENNKNTETATGLSNTICKDGQSTPTANIPMGSFRLTNLGVATARTDAARASQVQDSTMLFIQGTAGTNTVTGSVTPAITAYVTGQKFHLLPANTNTGATTLNINSVGAGAVQWNGAALGAGALKQNVPAMVAVVTTTPVFEIVSTGSLTLTAPALTNYISFPGTQVPSAGANDFDDYEEGTWTPGVSFGGGTTGITYTTQTGRYTKVGRLVTVEFVISLSNKGSSSGTAALTGLPFSVAVIFTTAIRWGAMTSSLVCMFGRSTGAGATLTIEGATAAATGQTDLTDADFANTTGLAGTFSYSV